MDDVSKKKSLCRDLTLFLEMCNTRPYEYHSDLPSCDVVKEATIFIGCSKKKNS